MGIHNNSAGRRGVQRRDDANCRNHIEANKRDVNMLPVGCGHTTHRGCLSHLTEALTSMPNVSKIFRHRRWPSSSSGLDGKCATTARSRRAQRRRIVSEFASNTPKRTTKISRQSQRLDFLWPEPSDLFGRQVCAVVLKACRGRVDMWQVYSAAGLRFAANMPRSAHNRKARWEANDATNADRKFDAGILRVIKVVLNDDYCPVTGSRFTSFARDDCRYSDKIFRPLCTSIKRRAEGNGLTLV